MKRLGWTAWCLCGWAAAALGAEAVPADGGLLRASYAAHIAAAGAHLRLGETAPARRWLAGAPESLRGWEWHHLQAQLDHSLRSVELAADPYTLALRPGSGQAAVACDDGVVRVFNWADGALVREFTGHEAAVYGVTYSPDGRRLASASHDSTIRIWDADTGKELSVYRGHHYPVGAVAFSPDGALMASATYEYVKNEAGKVTGVDGEVHLWDPQSGQRSRVLPAGHKPISSIAFTPDGRRLAIGSWNGDAYLWDLPDGADEGRMLTIPDEGRYTAINDIAFSPDGRWLCAGSKDHTVRVWDAASGELAATLRGHAGWVNGLAFSPDGLHLATAGSDDVVRLWDTGKWALEGVLRGHGKAVQAVSWDAASRQLVSVGGDRTLRVWDVSRRDFDGPRMDYAAAGTYSAAFSPDGRQIAMAVSAELGGVCLWDAATGGKVAEWKGHEGGSCHMLAYSQDGSRLVTCSWDKTVKMWDPATQALLRTFEHEAGVYDCAISRDGKRVATAPRDRTVRVWDADSGKSLATLSGHEGEVRGVQFSPQGDRVASCGVDGTARVWEITSEALQATLTGHKGTVSSAAFSPDGAYIVTGGEDGTVRLWEAAGGVAVRTLLDSDEQIDRVAFSPDGKRVAAGGEVLHLLDVAGGGELLAVDPLGDGIYHLSFSPDGKRLAVCTQYGKIAVLETEPYGLRSQRANEVVAASAPAQPR